MTMTKNDIEKEIRETIKLKRQISLHKNECTKYKKIF